MSEITAYEKMLEDGSAFKKIDMNKIANQMYAEGGGATKIPSEPLGEPTSNMQEDNTDWSSVDAAMEKRMNALREKMKGGSTSTSQPLNESQEITKLKKRVKRLEEALMVIMETQEKLLG